MNLDKLNYFSNVDIFPPVASTFGVKVDVLFYFLTILSVVATLGIFAALIIVAIKFRRIEGQERESHHLESPALEITWTVIPFFIFIAVFIWGAKLYAEYLKVPEGALQIEVVGKQWMWKAQHPNGMREVNNLHVPMNQPIRITLSSEDVIHDYSLPAMRVKQDVVPGRFTYVWFEATRTGSFPIFCSQYCGTEHSYMTGTVTVLTPEGYAEWLAGGPKKTPVEAGEFLFQQRGCVTCHTGMKDSRCPDLKGVYGSTGRMVDGEVVFKNEDYLYESILYSSKRIVEGYTAVMPSFANQLTAEDVQNLIAYIKSLGGRESAAGAAGPAQPKQQ